MTYAEHALEISEKATEGPWEEVWKDIPGLTGYQVSDFGSVRSRLRRGNYKFKYTQKYRLLKKCISTSGRYTVSVPMGRNGNYGHKTLYFLVMLAFVGPRPKGFDIAHLNGDHQDDRLVNLKYCTHKENESHKKMHGTAPVGELNGISKLQGWQVDEIRYLGSKSIPQAKIAKLFDIRKDYVSQILGNITWKHRTTRQDAPELARRLQIATETLKAICLSDSETCLTHIHGNNCAFRELGIELEKIE